MLNTPQHHAFHKSGCANEQHCSKTQPDTIPVEFLAKSVYDAKQTSSGQKPLKVLHFPAMKSGEEVR